MKINSVSQNVKKYDYPSPTFKSIYLPNAVGEFGKFVGEFIGIPEKKLIQNTTALFLQPNFDLKYADDDEKTDIAIKSASKAIAGGITGVTIRSACINFFQKRINFDPKNKSIINKLLLPEEAEKLRRKSENLGIRRLKMYNETLGTIAAIVIMVTLTNKNIDVPLTGLFQDIIGGVVKENKSWKRSIYDTYTERKNKYENWLNKQKSKDKEIRDKWKKISNIIKEDPSNTKLESRK